VSDRVRMVGTGHHEKLLEAIGSAAMSSSSESSGSLSLLPSSPLGPPLVAFGAPLWTLAGYLVWCPSTTTRGRPPITLDENGPDHLHTRGMPVGDAEQLLHVHWLIVAELMH
jgi:hypothetical protein